jgi:ABC-type branched-subunit amino acid transport system substrate-binding protein
MTRLLSLLVISIFAFALLGCAKSDNNVVKIALVAPLTGDQAELGIDELHAAQLAVDEVNARGGINGKKIVLVGMDDKHDPLEATKIANNLVADSSIIAVIGHLNSGTSIPASKIYNQGGLLMITPSATNPQLTKQGFNNVFRMCATDEIQGPAMADYLIKDKKYKKIVTLNDKSQYGQGLVDTFTAEADKLRVKIIFADAITQGDKDFVSVLTRIKALNPDVIYFGGMHSEAGLIAKQAKSLGINAKIAGGDGMFGTEFGKIAGDAASNAIVSFQAPPYDKANNPNMKNFVANYTAKYGKIVQYAPYSYDAASLVINAISKAEKQDRAGVITTMRGTKDFDGVTGKVNFAPNGDVVNATFYFYTFDAQGMPAFIK